jgi:hypothetical protein
MDVSEATLLVQQINNFHTELHHVQDKLNEARLDMMSQLHALDKEVRVNIQGVEARWLSRLEDIERKLDETNGLQITVANMTRTLDGMQRRMDDTLLHLLKEKDGKVTINNHSNVDAGLRVDKIDRVDGDVFQGEKHERDTE